MRLHQHHYRHTSKKRPTKMLFALGLWFVLAISVFAWFSVQNNAYQKQATAFQADIQQTFSKAKATFKAAHDSGDATARQKAVTALADELKAKKAPQAPALLGVSLGMDALRAKQARLSAGLQTYEKNLRNIAAYQDYQQQVVVKLQLLSLKSATNYDQLVELAKAWHEAAAAITNITPPSDVKDVNATLVQKVNAIEPIIAKLAELYKNVDEPGFAAKQAELAAAVAAFKPVGDEIARIAAGLDASAAADLANIYKNL